MASFESWRDYSSFAHHVRREARHILGDKSQSFISAVQASAEKRSVGVGKGTILWRAQLAFDWGEETVRDEDDRVIEKFEIPCPAARKRMVPLEDRAFEGRVNPKGIPCLYLSTEKNTAMSEVRPWVGSYISVAEFVVLRDVRVVDCSSDTKREFGLSELLNPRKVTPDRIERQVWYDINHAFSEPVTRTDDVAEYAPTQVLAEVFRSAGFEGIVYGSRLGTGKTVAIFDVSAADLINCQLHEVEAVNFTFGTAGNPYFVSKYYSSSGKFAIPDGAAESPENPSTETQAVTD